MSQSYPDVKEDGVASEAPSLPAQEPMTPAPKVDLRISLQMAGWAAAIGLWFITMALMMKFGESEAIRSMGANGLFIGGIALLIMLGRKF